MKLRHYLDPRTSWRDTSTVDKVRLYTLQSFGSIVVVIGIVAVAENISNSERSAAAAIVVCVLTVTLVLLRLPQMGGQSSGDIRALLTVALASGAAAAILAGQVTALWMLLILGIPCSALVALRWSLLGAAVIAGATALFGFGLFPALAVLFTVTVMAVTVKLSIWLLRLVTELDASREATAALSVAEERLRFSRDLHDVVGRALSAIAVKSELAATLSRRGDPRAAEQMDEVRDLAQQSMTEARQLVRGYRSIDLASEIDGARSLLTAAGIATDVLGSAQIVPPDAAEAAAWVVREGATNILRHSDATRCRIEVHEGTVHIVNDRPHPAGPDAGTGIGALRERLVTVGGTVRTTHTSEEFGLYATFGTGETT